MAKKNKEINHTNLVTIKPIGDNQKAVLYYPTLDQSYINEWLIEKPSLSPKKYQSTLNRLIEKKMAFRCELGLTHPTEWGKSIISQIRKVNYVGCGR